MNELLPPLSAVDAAILSATESPCRSQRGAVIFQPATASRAGFIVARGFNAPPPPLRCDRSDRCRISCSRAAVHAEQRALLDAGRSAQFAEMLHVKVQEGELVASGPPSCVECSKLALAAGISGFWLYHAAGWAHYTMLGFHGISLAAKGITLI
jgi:deoxycytidylate deaminase